MQVTIKPGAIQGTINVPASKSMMQRICAAALLHQGTTTIHNPGTSDDDIAALEIIRQCGAEVIYHADGSLRITGDGKLQPARIINCGESGLSSRMFIPILSMSDLPVTITGTGSLLQRPMHTLTDILPQLGVNIQSKNGYLPIQVQGPLTPQEITIDGSTSSQYLTGLLFAFAYSAVQPVLIKVHSLKSKPYIDLTLQVSGTFGRHITHEQYEIFHVDPDNFEDKKDISVHIESDWSSAAFWLVAGAVSGDIKLPGLNPSSTQADKAILDVLQKTGAKISVQAKAMEVRQTENLQPFKYDATDTPDLFPALAILAAACRGESHISGIHRLQHKESNRTASISTMLTALGVAFSVMDDTLIIAGGSRLQSCRIDSCHDHRIAMAASVAALIADGPVTVTNADAVSKSYPDFFSHLSSVGGKLTINDTTV